MQKSGHWGQAGQSSYLRSQRAGLTRAGRGTTCWVGTCRPAGTQVGCRGARHDDYCAQEKLLGAACRHALCGLWVRTGSQPSLSRRWAVPLDWMDVGSVG